MIGLWTLVWWSSTSRSASEGCLLMKTGLNKSWKVCYKTIEPERNRELGVHSRFSGMLAIVHLRSLLTVNLSGGVLLLSKFNKEKPQPPFFRNFFLISIKTPKKRKKKRDHRTFWWFWTWRKKKKTCQSLRVFAEWEKWTERRRRQRRQEPQMSNNSINSLKHGRPEGGGDEGGGDGAESLGHRHSAALVHKNERKDARKVPCYGLSNFSRA